MKLLLSLLTLFPILLSAQSDDSTTPTRVTCIGDSITARGYPAQLEQALGKEWRVTNCGKGGAKILSEYPLTYTDLKVYQKALTSTPDYVIIMLGVNDANPKFWNDSTRQQQHPTEFKQRYIDLIHSMQALESKPQIIVAIPLPVVPENLAPGRLRIEREGRQNNLNKDIIPLIKQTAEQEEVTLIDMQSLMEPLAAAHTPDGVHYTKEGSKLFTTFFKEAILKLEAQKDAE